MPIKLIHITTIPETLHAFCKGQARFLKRKGINFIGVSSPGNALIDFSKTEDVDTKSILIYRNIRPIYDLISLFKLYKLIRSIKPEIVHFGTSKAALLGSIASWSTKVPVRIYHVRGSFSEYYSGIIKLILLFFEWLTALLSNQVIFNSESSKKYCHDSYLPLNKGIVLCNGSSNGLNSTYFDPNDYNNHNKSKEIRKDIIKNGELLIGYLGRIAEDKGIEEIYNAFKIIQKTFKVKIILVGEWGESNKAINNFRRKIINKEAIIITGHVDNPASYLLAMDIFIYPSHGSEGLPNAVLEASAMELPVVATKVVGCIDAVVDGVTGILVPPRDPIALADAIRTLLNDAELRKRMGKAGRERVIRDFKPEDIWEALYQEYVRLLKEKGIPVPEPLPEKT